MRLETQRLLLRPWREEDAESLYRWASDPLVGPAAGWPAHTSAEDSRRVIRDIFSAPDTFAVCPRKADAEPIGSVGIFPTKFAAGSGESEIGYWIARPFWGRGLIPEAVRELLRVCFDERGEERVWCAHFEGNEKSKRVIEKCGFSYVAHDTAYMPQIGENRLSLYYAVTKEQWNHG